MDVSIYTPNNSLGEFPFFLLSLQHTLFVDFFSNGHSDQGELISHYMRLYCLAQWCAQLLSSVQSLSRVPLFATPWITAHQASLSITNSRSSLRLTFIKSVMPSKHLPLCHSLFLLPSIFRNKRVFFKESVLCIRWPKYWSFSFIISLFNEYSELMVG